MLLADLPKLLLRRWYAVLPGLVACVLLGVLAGRAVPPKLESTASVVMVPSVHTTGVGGNPYLALGGLESVADVVARRVVTPEISDDLERLGVTGFTVVRDAATAAPMVLITVEGTDEAAVAEGVDVLVDAIPGALRSLQQSLQIPDSDLITTQVVSEPGSPVVSRSPQLRAILVAVAGGLLLTLALVALLDLALNRRARRLSLREEPRYSVEQEIRLGSVPTVADKRAEDPDSEEPAPRRRVSGNRQ